MNIGKVVGTVVATRKDETLVGFKLLVAQPLDLHRQPQGAARVMVDTVGAGVGELVLYVTGAAARNAIRSRDGAVDTAVVGIIDQLDVNFQLLDQTGGDAEGEKTIE